MVVAGLTKGKKSYAKDSTSLKNRAFGTLQGRNPQRWIFGSILNPTPYGRGYADWLSWSRMGLAVRPLTAISCLQLLP